MNESNVKTNSNDEASILLSLGSTLTSQNTYESQVLNEVVLRHVPTLSGNGFPDLSSLPPSSTNVNSKSENDEKNNDENFNKSIKRRKKSYSPPIDLPHILTTLSKVRSSLHSLKEENTNNSFNKEETVEALKLQMKYQILLTYLAQNSNLSKEEVGLDMATERRGQERRRNRLWADSINKNGSKLCYENGLLVAKNDTSQTPQLRKENNSRGHQQLKYGPQKLEDIKNQSQSSNDATPIIFSASKNASFGKQALESSVMSRKIQQYKQAQQKIRRDDESKVVVDDPVVLYRKRRERRETKSKRQNKKIGNKRQRRKRRYSDKYSSSNGRRLVKQIKGKSYKDNSSIEIKNENEGKTMEVTEANEKTVEIQSCNQSCINLDGESKDEKDSIPKSILCPICNETLNVPQNYVNDIDTFLSQHMSTCQKRSSARLIGRRRKLICYKEDDDEQDVNNEPKNNGPSSLQCRDVVEEEIADVLSISSDTSSSDDQGVFVREQAIDDYNEDNYEDRVDEWIESGVGKMKVMAERDVNEEKPGAVVFPGGLEVPAWINDRLFGYQRVALRWMWELHRQMSGGIVGDEMGLGKTVQVASYLGAMAASRKLSSVLIIAPATMLMHWLSELETWAPGLRRILVHNSAVEKKDSYHTNRNISSRLLNNLEKWLTSCRANRVYEPIDANDYQDNDPDSFCGTGYVMVTTYENIRRAADAWVNHQWSYVVMDEGQKIRNPDADVTLACKRFRTPHRLLLSGTPIQNDLRELWSLLDFVFPGKLGTLPVFESEFAYPIKRGGYTNASPMQVQLGFRCALVLRDLINPYLLRRQKKNLKEVSRFYSVN